MPTDPPTPPTPEFVPSGYTVVQHLGAGQTSIVYLAGHPRLGQVALKLPRAELHDDPVLRRMFENEAQITVKLQHPNIVRAFEGYPTGPRAYLALEYCPGGTLDQRLLETGRMSLGRTIDLILEIGEGLKHTHDQRVLHRDVKPANVFLDGEGRAKLGDFGTGVFMAEDNAERVGTAFYMAPEIFEGGKATIQSDIYSLGVVAYELLTGSRPFTGTSFEELMFAHLKQLPRDPRSLREDLPRGVASVALRAMNRDRGKRYASMSEFLDALREAAGRSTAEEPAIVPGRAGRVRKRGDDPPDAGDAGANGDDGEERRGLFGWLRRLRRS